MERSEWDDDEQYPPAPVPAHERGWRHPSELGEQAWTQSEPPLAIGRGLTVATGAVGGLLALAVLWAMLPTHAGRSAVVSVRSTLAAAAGGLLTDTTLLEATTTTLAAAPTTTLGSPATLAGQLGSTSTERAGTSPIPTYQVHPTGSSAQGAVAVAVSVAAGSLVITTATAVDADNTVELRLPDGKVEQAHVLLVDQRSGLAVLAPDTADDVTRFAVAAGPTAGEVLTVYGDERLQLPVDAEGIVHTEAADTALPEGTPVVNQRGELVALCSHGDKGIVLVQLDTLEGLRRLEGSSAPPVWLGVVLNDDPSGELSVAAVDPSGPAAAAGLTAGDVIVAIDGQAVASRRQLTAALSAHRPGDAVAVTVTRGDGAPTVVQVTVAAPKASI